MSEVIVPQPQLELNPDGSPKAVYCPAYQTQTAVTTWYEYFYYQVFNGFNYNRANTLASLQVYRLNN